MIVEIVKDFERLSNFRFDWKNIRELIEDSETIPNKTNVYVGCIELVKANLVDFCPLLLTVMEERLKYVDFLSPYLFSGKMVAYVISSDDHDDARYWAVLRVFDFWLWMGIVGVVALFPVLCWLVRRGGGYWGYFEQMFGFVVRQNVVVGTRGWYGGFIRWFDYKFFFQKRFLSTS